MRVTRRQTQSMAQTLDQLGRTRREDEKVATKAREKEDEEQKKRRLAKAAMAFMRLKDKGAESIQKFAKEYDLELNDLQSIVAFSKGLDHYVNITKGKPIKQANNGEHNFPKGAYYYEKDGIPTMIPGQKKSSTIRTFETEGTGVRDNLVAPETDFDPRAGWSRTDPTTIKKPEQMQIYDTEAEEVLQMEKDKATILMMTNPKRYQDMSRRVESATEEPGQTLKEKIKEKEALSAAGTRGRLSETPKKPEMTRAEALEEQENIYESILELKEGGKVSEISMILAITMGRDISKYRDKNLPAKEKDDLLAAYQRRLSYLEQFADARQSNKADEETIWDVPEGEGEEIVVPKEYRKKTSTALKWLMDNKNMSRQEAIAHLTENKDKYK